MYKTYSAAAAATASIPRYCHHLHHQAVEAKEGIPIQAESLVTATITFQLFFRQYERLAGMTVRTGAGNRTPGAGGGADQCWQVRWAGRGLVVSFVVLRGPPF